MSRRSSSRSSAPGRATRSCSRRHLPGGNVVPPAKHDITIAASTATRSSSTAPTAQERDRRPRRRRLDPQHVRAQLPRERVLLGRRGPLPRVVPDRLERAGLRHLRRGRRDGTSTTTTSRAPRTPRTTSASASRATRRSRTSSRALSAVGYSGTNATRRRDPRLLWDRNGAGIVPNTYANEALPPQARTTIVRNTVTSSGRARVPIRTALAGFVGIGIAVAGGNENSIHGNRVTGSERYGIAVFPTARFVTFDPNAPRARPAVAAARKPGHRGTSSPGAAGPTSRSRRAPARGNCFTANTRRDDARRAVSRPRRARRLAAG